LNLAIDIGNTQTKVGLFKGHELVESNIVQTNNLITELKEVIDSKPIAHIGISSVASLGGEEVLAAIPEDIKGLVINSDTDLPISIDYQTQQTLGPDRICGVVGARFHFPKSACLVIDAGTCITYDFIDKNGVFLGGGISPGLRMRLKSMHNYSSKLPLVEINQHVSLIGASTAEALQSGAFHGLKNEIRGTILSYLNKYSETEIILTGGDSSLFAQHIENPIFAAPNLILEGINQILSYNYNE